MNKTVQKIPSIHCDKLKSRLEQVKNTLSLIFQHNSIENKLKFVATLSESIKNNLVQMTTRTYASDLSQKFKRNTFTSYFGLHSFIL